MSVFRLQNPYAFTAEPVVALFQRAFAKHPRTSAKDAIAALMPAVGQPNVGVFIGEQGGELKGLGIVFLPVTKLHPYPQVYYLYCPGSSAARRELVTAIVEYVTSAGYNEMWAINMVGDDKAYGRLFKEAGPSQRLGSILRFDLEHRDGRTIRGRSQQQQQHATGLDTGPVRRPASAPKRRAA